MSMITNYIQVCETLYFNFFWMIEKDRSIKVVIIIMYLYHKKDEVQHQKGDVHLKFSGQTIALLRNLMSNLGQILHVKRFFVTETGPTKVEVIQPL